MLLERISVGGMAEVWKAKEFGVEGFERTVAVKKILPHVAEDEEFIAMFKDEAKIAVQLSHGNIAQIYNLGAEQDSFYIALEYVAGKDLRAIFQRCQEHSKPMPAAQACFIVMKICEGLDYAHNKKDKYGRDLNIVHRDVSPPNILVSYEGEVKLIDFGVAKAAGRVSKTQAGILKGKFGYMSPEQVRGMPLDRRSDVFSVGVLLWEVLASQRLFQGETDFDTLEKVRAVEVPKPSKFNAEIPGDLEEIVFKALAGEPGDRFQSAIELHDALQAFMFAHGMFYSRKDLSAWMRQQYAKEIDAEKERAQQQGVQPPRAGAPNLRNRRTMMMPPGGGPPPGGRKPPPPPPGGRKPPPPPGRRKTAPPTPPAQGGAIPKPSSLPTEAHPAIAAAEAPAASGRGKRKTLVMSTGKPNLPAPGSQASVAAGPKTSPPRPGPPSKPAARPKPAAAVAAAEAPAAQAAAEAADFDWDDDELETRLFEGGEDKDISEANRQSDMASARSVEPARIPATGGARGRREPVKTEPQKVVPITPGFSQGPALVASAAGAAVSVPAAALEMDERPAGTMNYKLIGAVAAVLIVAAGVLGWFAMREDKSKQTAESAVAGKAVPVVAQQGSLTVDVTPPDSEVLVDGKLQAGTSPFMIAGLGVGTHKVAVRKGDAFLPFERSVEVKPGSQQLLPVKLELREVTLALQTDPPGASVALLAGGNRTAIGVGGDNYKLQRAPGVAYEIEATAKGYVASRMPLLFEGGAVQTVKLSLVRAAGAEPPPTPTPEPGPATGPAPTPKPKTPAPRPKPPKPRPPSGEPKPRPKPSGGGAKTATIGVAGAPGAPPATVLIDGKNAGKTPLAPGKYKVSAGSHSVKCSWPDGKTHIESVTVPDGGRKIVKCRR